ncbi:MAG: TIGR02611 family protein, partial [Gordonia sp. (in: high G+C Gram-positive bacteria)]|uniref:TIGR02611 family protein n=1 Tax=Gordonia sp. (in: high G+C Gram-positive bacteria) TaxID=84139 RepID=UPI003BB5467D
VVDRAKVERERIRPNPRLNAVYRTGVGFVGTIMILGGAMMVPLPTPGFGWILIFLGLGVLSTEFVWAKKVAHGLRRALDYFEAWWGRRSLAAKTGLIVAVVVIILLFLWLAGMLGTMGSWFGWRDEWLSGPIRGHI